MKTGAPPLSGTGITITYLWAMRCPVYRQRDFHLGFGTELENLIGCGKGKGASGSPARPKVPMRRSVAAYLVLAWKRDKARGAKGQAIRVMLILVNWQQEEPIGRRGGRQRSIGWYEPCDRRQSRTDL